MADVIRINGVAIDDIVSLNGVDIANVSKINNNVVSKVVIVHTWTKLSGSVTITDNSFIVYGNSTKFLDELKDESIILIDGQERQVTYITSDTHLVVKNVFVTSVSGMAIEKQDEVK